MPRKGENITKRKDKRWEGRYIAGRHADGRAKYGSVYGKSYDETRAKLLPLKMTAAKPLAEGLFCGTFGEYAKLWFAEKSKHVKPSTRDNYERSLQNHILPALGEFPMQRLCPQNIEDLKALLTAKGLSNGTARNILLLLTSITRRAALTGAIERDACLDLKLSKAPQHKEEALTRVEQRRLEKTATQHENGFAVTLALYTGLRIGELCALRWEDVDLSRRVLHVKGSVQRLKNPEKQGALTAIKIGAPKSESSRRTVPLPESLLFQLLRRKAEAKSEYVIECRGGLAEPRVVQYRFGRLLEQAGLRHVKFHALRHTFATRCMELGMDAATISGLMGHASVKMTLDIYTASLLEHRLEAVKLLDQLAA